MDGFFSAEFLTRKRPLPLSPQCGECKLWTKCKTPKIGLGKGGAPRPFGKGLRKILVVGEAPGAEEEKQGAFFVGKTGSYLRRILNRVGVDLQEDCWTWNSVLCRPRDPDGNNRPPNDKEMSACRPALVRIIQELKPHVIIPLGGAAVGTLLSWLWKESAEASAFQWLGWRIPSQKINAWVCPTWHPSFVDREITIDERKGRLIERLFTQYLKAAAELEGTPWGDSVPNYLQQVQCIFDPERAAIILGGLVDKALQQNKPLAFDYETTTLKPESSAARIVTCAVSDGKTSIAYPWHGAAIQATRTFLRSTVAKIGANLKFEERWTLKEFGHGVNNWVWDTMLAAHTLDNRRKITSVKFQAFVLLGQDSWDEHISPYLKAGASHEENRLQEYVRSFGLRKVLEYNALDAILEHKIARIQMKQLRGSNHAKNLC